MTKRYCIARPRVITVVHWTGDNLNEVQETWPSLPYSVLEDGTLVTSMGQVPVGYWTDGDNPLSNEDVELYLGSNQELTGPGPYNYNVTERT